MEMEGIGDRIRAERLAQGWTLQALSSRCGLSASFLSQVERDRASPSIVSLGEISRALGLSLHELFATEPAQRADRFVSRSGDRLHLKIANRDVSYAYLSGSFRARSVDLLISTLPPGHWYDSDPHHGEEFGYVLSGAFILIVDGARYLLKPGDSYHFPSDRKHAYATPEDRGAEILWGTTAKLLADFDSSLLPEPRQSNHGRDSSPRQKGRERKGGESGVANTN